MNFISIKKHETLFPKNEPTFLFLGEVIPITNQLIQFPVIEHKNIFRMFELTHFEIQILLAVIATCETTFKKNGDHREIIGDRDYLAQKWKSWFVFGK